MGKMNAKTLKALKGSIEKWEKIVDGTGSDNGGENCQLCQMFLSCDGCPVAEYTGDIGCHGSPWNKWRDHFKSDFPFYARGKKSRALAQAELDFLKSLLPKEKAE